MIFDKKINSIWLVFTILCFSFFALFAYHVGRREAKIETMKKYDSKIESMIKSHSSFFVGDTEYAVVWYKVK